MIMADKPISRSEWLALHFVGGRRSREPSHALPSWKYQDPSTQEMPMYGTKEVEKMLAIPLDNWIRYGKIRDWMPSGYRCPLGFWAKIKERGASVTQEECVNPIDEPMAVRFEAVVKNLPERHRKAFVMHQIGRFAEGHRVVMVKGSSQAARLLGVQPWQYHNIVRQAANMVLTRWRG